MKFKLNDKIAGMELPAILKLLVISTFSKGAKQFFGFQGRANQYFCKQFLEICVKIDCFSTTYKNQGQMLPSPPLPWKPKNCFAPFEKVEMTSNFKIAGNSLQQFIIKFKFHVS